MTHGPRLVLVSALALLIVPLLVSNAHADLVLDQAFTPLSFEFDYSIYDARPDDTGFQDLAQTFTVGVAGELSAVELYLSARSDGSPLLFDVRSVTAGVPGEADGMVLASRVIDVSAVVAANGGEFVPGYYRIDLSATPLAVAPGDVLALVLRASGPLEAHWSGLSLGGYAPGEGYSRDDVIRSTWGQGVGDLGFRTFVEASAVPEPGSLALLGLGSIAILGYARRRIVK